MQIFRILRKTIYTTAVLALIACGGSAKNDREQVEHFVDEDGIEVEAAAAQTDDGKAVTVALPYSGDDIREHVVMDYGKRAIRSDADETISRKDLMKNKNNCFIVMSKKDFYLYVYEPQGNDTVMLARYDCCFALKKGNKERKGDMKTPHCTMKNPFKISQMADASTWHHDFGDGRGNIKAYGDWFLRLVTPGHSGIGIHGSTNNRGSVPGRASEGCIRLKDEDIIDLRKNYAFVGMKVVIKAEDVDDLPFEIRAMQKQNIQRKRHFDPKKTLTNEQIQKAVPEKASNVKSAAANYKTEREEMEEIVGNIVGEQASEVAGEKSKNMTLEELDARR